MARVTVEDCLVHIDNRFELVLAATRRARQLVRGEVDPTVPWENDKVTVVALREVAAGFLNSQGEVVSSVAAPVLAVEKKPIAAPKPDMMFPMPDLTPPVQPIPPVVALSGHTPWIEREEKT